jgi:CRISPR/Cas system-associated protein endoribonuclease Cas2
MKNENAKSEANTALRRASALSFKTARPKVVHRYSRAKSRGQISAEFVITLILLFLMFSVIVFISAQQKENINFSSDKIKAKTLMEKVSRAVNGIYLSGNGSTTKIAKNFDLNLGVEENILMVKFGKGQFVSASLLTKRIVFIQKDNASEIEIRNKDGVIEIEEL